MSENVEYPATEVAVVNPFQVSVLYSLMEKELEYMIKLKLDEMGCKNKSKH